MCGKVNHCVNQESTTIFMKATINVVCYKWKVLADAIVCVPAAVEDGIPVQNYVDNFMCTSESGRGILLMFTDKAYNKAILNEDKSVDFISGLAPLSHPSSGFSVSYEHCMIVFRMLARQRCMMRC